MHMRQPLENTTIKAAKLTVGGPYLPAPGFINFGCMLRRYKEI